MFSQSSEPAMLSAASGAWLLIGQRRRSRSASWMADFGDCWWRFSIDHFSSWLPSTPPNCAYYLACIPMAPRITTFVWSAHPTEPSFGFSMALVFDPDTKSIGHMGQCSQALPYFLPYFT